MQNNITLKIPSDIRYFKLIKSTIKKLGKEIFNSKEQTKELSAAVKELVENAIQHAYSDHEGEIEISFFPFEYGIRVDVRDWGIPMSSTKHLSVPVAEKHDEGFNRIYNLTDSFEYTNLGKEGKKFSVIKYAAQGIIDKEFLLRRIVFEEEDDQKSNAPLPQPLPRISVREFAEGDEEKIALLIYRNYGNSYIKESFYFPMQILQNEGKKYFSVIAESEGTIIGHFALIKAQDSNIAEVGIVVVDPAYKGMGVMNRMFEAVILHAVAIDLDAIFGEAIMYHPFSQKSNLSRGFSESALELGKIPADVALSNNMESSKGKRGPVLVAHKLLKEQKKGIFFPKRYESIMRKTYTDIQMITLVEPTFHEPKTYSHLRYTFDPVSNIATIIINNFGEDFPSKFNRMLHHLQSKHCDMIYAHINLEQIAAIDEVVSYLNRRLFFYSGILFLRHENRDYLQLQHKHSSQVGRNNMICYSDFCKVLNDFIGNDEKGVRNLPTCG